MSTAIKLRDVASPPSSPQPLELEQHLREKRRTTHGEAESIRGLVLEITIVALIVFEVVFALDAE